jgi:hypothetical protein
MKYLGYACTYLLFLSGILGILSTEIWHPKGAVLDTPILWILISMFNLLRLRNGYSVAGLKVFCVGANLAGWVMEVVRFEMFGALDLIEGIPLLALTIFSIIRKSIGF